ncbi:thiolase family protein [Brevibacillus fluminis]|uniref:Thiolase family protein n=1 Tax=Brevibacillus fluminis TaxID=511487 RepID=A0A3M8DXP8_9BACL|nr:thiolase family protein [Brevibacillus fluminis]RNB92299.1 thiolase family protein [Brevibacillus fluminis]
MHLQTPVIVYAKRTPIGKVGGVLRDIEPHELAAALIEDAVQACKLDGEAISDVILGNVIGPGGNLARLSALEAGLPVTVPGVTVDRQCGSGLEAVQLACRLVQAGAGDIFLAGGVESTSRAPWKMEKPSNLYGRLPRLYGRARFSPDAVGDPEMGEAAENVALHYGIAREEQDRWALESHRRYFAALQGGAYRDQILPFRLATGDVTADECPRADSSMEKLARLRPVFCEGGTVTAGNACPINDGAALVVVMSAQKAAQLGIAPMLVYKDSVACGVDPNLLGTGPIPAVRQLLDRNGLVIGDIDRVEFNEAFASQVLACVNELAIPHEKINRDGGALALGHPYGASGTILVVSLAHGMRRTGGQYGLATLGIGGGMGLAVLFERGEYA